MTKIKRYLKSIVFLLLSFISFGTYAQSLQSRTISFSPNGVFDSVFDQYGNVYQLKNIAVNDTLRDMGLDTLIPLSIVSTYSSGYFKLYLDKNSGMENYATDSNHLARLKVVCQVLNDVSQFINSPCISTGQKINIWCRDIGQISNLPTNSHGVVTSFYSVPLIAGASGIADNTIWKTLNSGVDAYKNTGSVWNSAFMTGTTFFHGMLAFDFNSGGIISWNTSLTSGPPNAPNTYDLYTEVLHQVVHALGFASLISSNGNSILGATHPYYSRYDMNLKTASGTSLLSHTGSVSMYNYSFGVSTSVLAPGGTCYADSTVCSTAIKYYGGLSTPQAVYTPNCFEPGVSLGNLEDACPPSGSTEPMANNQYFLMSNVTSPGSLPGNTKRYPQKEEQQVLVDIGYSVNNHFGDSTNVHLNYINYGTSFTPGGQVAASNDGVNNGVYTLTTDTSGSLTFTGAALLGNDTGVTGGTFEGLQIVSGSGSFSVSSGSAGTSITLTGAASGTNIFSYVPVSAGGKRGNIAWGPLGRLTGACEASCSNLVPNPGFESATSCGPILSPAAAAFFGTAGAINCWIPFMITPDLYSSGCSTTTYYAPGWTYNVPNTNTYPQTSVHSGPGTNNNFLGLWSEWDDSTTFVDEGVEVLLGQNLVPGHPYTLTLFAKVANVNQSIVYIPLANLPGTINAGLSSGPLASVYGTPTSVPGFVNLNANIGVYAPNSAWTQYTFTFTCPSSATPLNNLIIYNAVELNPSVWPGVTYPHLTGHTYHTYVTYMMIDDVQLVAGTPATFTPPATISICASPLTNLTQYLHPSSVSGGTFGGVGISQASGGTFTPTAAGLGTQTIWYTYTDSVCGPTTLYANITVTPSTSISASQDTVCSTSAVTLTASSCTTCDWYSGSTLLYANAGSSITVYPTTTTTYSVVDTTYPNCPAYITVYSLGTTASIITAGLTSFCLGTPGPILTAAPANSAYSYTWQVSYNGGPYSAYTGSSSASITPIDTAAGSYRFRVVINNGICSDTSTTVTVTVFPLPAATLTSSADSTCGGSITLTAHPLGANSYTFNLNGTPGIPGINSQYTVTTQGAAQQYTVTIRDGNNCIATSPPVNITVRTTPAPTITTGPITICSGTSTTLSTPYGATYSYQWYSLTTPIPFATNNTYTTSAAGVYHVVVSIGGACPGSSASVTVNVTTSPTVTITNSDDTLFCVGSSVMLSGTVFPAGSYTYQWYNSGVPVGTGINYTATTSGSYYLVATPTAGGCSGTSRHMTVIAYTVPATPVIAASGPVTFCQGGRVILSTTPVAGYTYQWYVNNHSITGATTASDTATGSGTYYLIVYNGVCSKSSNSIAVNVLPALTDSLSGNATFCLGSSGDHITTNVTPYNTSYTYQWYSNTTNSTTGGTLIPGATLNYYNATATGYYYAVVTETASGVSCSYTSTTAIHATAVPTPAPRDSITGLNAICFSGSSTTIACNLTGGSYTYQWFSNTVNNNTTGTVISGATSSTLTATTGGLYYYVVVSAGGCSGAATPVYVNLIGNDGCNPCGFWSGISNFTVLGSAGVSNLNNVANSSPTNYYVADVVTISGHTTLTNAYFMMAPGAKVLIDPAANVSMTHCHFWACETEWNSIYLLTNTAGNSTGKLTLINCLVENAKAGVTIANAANQATIFTSSGSIFNLDDTGVYITNYAYNTTPFSIVGTVFDNSGLNGSYNSWPSTSTLLAVPGGATYFTPPYALATSTYLLQVPHYCGIYLNGVGTNTTAITIGNNTTGSNANLFYNYQYGIYSANSTLNLQNNGFVTMTKDGVYASANSWAYSFSMPGGTNNNKFYNCNSSAVEAFGYQNFSAIGAKIVGNNSSATNPGTPSSPFGYYVTSNTYSSGAVGIPRPPSNTTISGDTITNVSTGINLMFTGSNYPTPNATINKNVIQIDPAVTANPSLQTSSTKAVDFAIVVKSIIASSAGLIAITPGELTIFNNSIYDPYMGIIASGFNGGQQISTYSNVNMRMRYTPSILQQMGISYYNCPNGVLHNNTVTGLPGATLEDNMRGIYVGGGSLNTVLQCNTVENIGRGFMFDNGGAQTHLTWTPGNNMQNCLKGVDISFNKIGTQGTTSAPLSNNWNNPGQWTSVPVPHYQTYTENGATASQSTFVCVNNPVNYPTMNNSSSNPGVSSTIYSPGQGLSFCTSCYNMVCLAGSLGPVHIGPTAVADMEQVAKDQVTYNQNDQIDRWMAQYNLYKATLGNAVFTFDTTGTFDSTTVTYEYPTDSSTILNTFYSMAQYSRYAYLTNIEQDITAGDFADAKTLIASPPSGYVATDDGTGVSITDNSTADYIVSNYLQYDNLLINHTLGNMTGTDSSNLAAMAAMCPVTNGNVVYQARALYDIVFDTITLWNDSSLCATHGRELGIGATPQGAVQGYTLHPNPNNGNMTILQAQQDNNPVQAEVWNEEGQVMYSNTLIFNQQSARVNIGDAVPGLYLLQLRDSKGRSYTLKFIVH